MSDSKLDQAEQNMERPDQEPPSQKKPGFIRRFIDKLAEDNKETFGTSRLDCCDLNKNNRPKG